MDRRTRWARILSVVGMAATVIGCVDPLEGSLLILPGTLLVAVSALLVRSPHRKIAWWAFVLTAVGVGILFGLSALGGVGGETGRSVAWLLVVLPYPVGVIMALITGVRLLRELFARRGSR